jgi:hypothetical protein
MHVGNRRKSAENVDLVTDASSVVRKSRKHLGGSLRVADVRDLVFTSLGSDKVNLSWQIVLSHLIETKVPKLSLVFNWVQSDVLFAVDISSVVSKPDIVACLCDGESWRELLVHDESLRTSSKSMLHENYWHIGLSFKLFCLDMLDTQKVSIFGLNLEGFEIKSVPIANLSECSMSVGVKSACLNHLSWRCGFGDIVVPSGSRKTDLSVVFGINGESQIDNWKV